MEEKDNKSIQEKILEDLYKSLQEKEDFDEFMIERLKILGKSNQLSNQKAIEDLIIPKQIPE